MAEIREMAETDRHMEARQVAPGERQEEVRAEEHRPAREAIPAVPEEAAEEEQAMAEGEQARLSGGDGLC
jgi:hypothetical protein